MLSDSLNPKIIFEDNSLLVIDKPEGITVNNAETTKGQITIQNWLKKKLIIEIENAPNSLFSQRAGIVHRLDKETSGILIIAKNQTALDNLQKQFKERLVKKKYLTLVHGFVEPKQGVIKAPIDRLPWNRQHFGVFPGGREAITEYKVISYYKSDKEKYSFIEVSPQTGRTHQIRVHFKYLGHPVVGDALYAGRKTARIDRQFCRRQFLHASFLQIRHPVTNHNLSVDSPLPGDLKITLDSLTKI